MMVQQIGNRGILFMFDDETAVYLINAEKKLFLCDTHLGPDSMAVVKKYIADNQLAQKELIIFNSHSDWDHIWGNCAFANATIIGSQACKKRMQERGEMDLALMPAERKKGVVEIKLPNLTFEGKISFAEDGIEFIHTPGHTICSSICFDCRESVVYVGDLIERPIPYLLHYDLESYIKSLEFIKDLNAKIIISAHSGVVDEELADANSEYIKSVMLKKPVELEKDFLRMHDFNVKYTMILRYESSIREKLGARFEYKTFIQEFWGSLGVKYEDMGLWTRHVVSRTYEDLEAALQAYIAKL